MLGGTGSKNVPPRKNSDTADVVLFQQNNEYLPMSREKVVHFITNVQFINGGYT